MGFKRKIKQWIFQDKHWELAGSNLGNLMGIKEKKDETIEEDEDSNFKVTFENKKKWLIYVSRGPKMKLHFLTNNLMNRSRKSKINLQKFWEVAIFRKIDQFSSANLVISNDLKCIR